jgi:hypothetical protein
MSTRLQVADKRYWQRVRGGFVIDDAGSLLSICHRSVTHLPLICHSSDIDRWCDVGNRWAVRPEQRTPSQRDRNARYRTTPRPRASPPIPDGPCGPTACDDQGIGNRLRLAQPESTYATSRTSSTSSARSHRQLTQEYPMTIRPGTQPFSIRRVHTCCALQWRGVW